MMCLYLQCPQGRQIVVVVLLECTFNIPTEMERQILLELSASIFLVYVTHVGGGITEYLSYKRTNIFFKTNFLVILYTYNCSLTLNLSFFSGNVTTFGMFWFDNLHLIKPNPHYFL